MCSVNSHLTTRQENERLKGIMARIETYDVVVNVTKRKNKIFFFFKNEEKFYHIFYVIVLIKLTKFFFHYAGFN